MTTIRTDDAYNELYDYLIDCGIATENEIGLITGFGGCNLEVLEYVLFNRTGYRSLEQIKEYED